MDVARLDPADLDAIRPAWLALVGHLDALDTGMGPVRREPELWERRRARYAGWLEADGRAAIFVAREHGGVLGYAHVRVGPEWEYRVTGDPVGDLETLTVLDAARGRGVGTALWAAAEAHLRELGARWVTVGTSTANRDALRFYARHGFGPVVSHWWWSPIPQRPAPAGVVVEPVADVDALAVHHRALADHHASVGPEHLPPRREPGDIWRLVRDEHAVPGHVLLRAGDDGYVHGHMHERGFDVWDTGPIGRVDTLVVRDGARGAGVGAALLHAAAGELAARGAQALTLEVLAGNTRAERFYSREGMTRVLETLIKRLD